MCCYLINYKFVTRQLALLHRGGVKVNFYANNKKMVQFSVAKRLMRWKTNEVDMSRMEDIFVLR